MGATLPSPRAYTSAVWDGKGNAYIFGGQDPSEHGLEEIVRYTPATDIATVVAALPSPRAETSAIWDGFGNAYIFGGYDSTRNYPGAFLDQIVRYTPETNAVNVELITLPMGVARSAAVWDGVGNAYILGGYGFAYDGFGFHLRSLDTIFQYILTPAGLLFQGNPRSSLPITASHMSAVWDASGRALVFGGHGEEGYYNHELTTDQIIEYRYGEPEALLTAAKLPQPAAGTSAVWDGVYAYVFGGERYHSGVYQDQIVRYDPNDAGPKTTYNDNANSYFVYYDANGNDKTDSGEIGVSTPAQNTVSFKEIERVRRMAPVDTDSDSYGDIWFNTYAQTTSAVEQLESLVFDSDGDQLQNIAEFRWSTIPIGPLVENGTVLFPNARDYDSDSWEDGPEVQYWNDESNDWMVAHSIWKSLRLSPTDPDHEDNPDRDNLTTTADPDSDNDGTLDGVEFYGITNGVAIPARASYPEFADSDCVLSATTCKTPAQQGTTWTARKDASKPGSGDGMNDKDELAAWNSIGPGAVVNDYDQDGIANNLLDPDSDGDDLLDGQELPCTQLGVCSRADTWDTDHDGLLDGQDLTPPISDPRYSLFTNAHILYRDGPAGRTFLGELSAGTNPTMADTDLDGMPDGWEIWYGTQATAPDALADHDNDEYSNLQEYAHAQPPNWNFATQGTYWNGTNPAWWDSDSDGLPDGWEAKYSFNPLSPVEPSQNPDNDGLTTLQEYQYSRPASYDESTAGSYQGGTNPTEPDSDGDGMPDGYEVRYGFNPRVLADGASDADNDGLSNADEYAYLKPTTWNVLAQGIYLGGTIPTDPDTDGDELCDGGGGTACTTNGEAHHAGEINDHHTNPFAWDSDNDGLPDAWEANYKLNGSIVAADPNVNDATLDGDSDSYPAVWCSNTGRTFNSRAEYQYNIPNGWDSRPLKLGGNGVYWGGTHPNEADTDKDGINDGYEVCIGTSPVQIDISTSDDSDNDGLSNGAEVGAGTNALSTDTDGDGLCDGGGGTSCKLGSAPKAPGEITNYHTNAVNADTDTDGWIDGPEATYWDTSVSGSVPNSDGVPDGDNLHDADSDNDGLSDYQEYLSRNGPEATDPAKSDTDGDGLTDKTETSGWNTTINTQTRHVTSNPAVSDTDLDSLNDAQEKSIGTNPRVNDTDADGLTDAQELNGWAIIVDGTSRLVTSDPTKSDTDGDGLSDGIENKLGTDPHAADTDADGVLDRIEDWNHDEKIDSGETNPTKRDTDADGLTDGQEFALDTDPLVTDTDGDGISDGDEVHGLVVNGVTYRTNATLADTDGDYLPDGEELGVGAAGGDPRRITNPLVNDTDSDGFLDGVEVNFYALNPLVADTDCDGTTDGADINPYYSNLPPDQTLTPQQKASCAAGAQAQGSMSLAVGAPFTGALQDLGPTFSVSLASLPLGPPAPADLLGPGVVPRAEAQPVTSDVGTIVFTQDGVIYVFANPPPRADISRVSVFLEVAGRFRVSASGTTIPESATVVADLRPDSAPGTSAYTYAVTVPLPEGMTEATGASFALTFTDVNLNSVVYTGSVQNEWTLDERTYQDGKTAVDEQDYNDPTGTTHNASGYNYVRTTTVARATNVDNPGVGTSGAQGSSDSWAYRIVQPSEAALVGSFVDGAFDLVPPSRLEGSAPVLFSLYTNTLVPINETTLQDRLPNVGPRHHYEWEDAREQERLSAAWTKEMSQQVPVETTVPKPKGTDPSAALQPVGLILPMDQRATPPAGGANTYSPPPAGPPYTGPPTSVMIDGQVVSLTAKTVDFSPEAQNKAIRDWVDSLDPATKEVLFTIGMTLAIEAVAPVAIAAAVGGARIAMGFLESCLPRAAARFGTEVSFLGLGTGEAALAGDAGTATTFTNAEIKFNQIGMTVGRSGQEASWGFTLSAEEAGPIRVSQESVARALLESKGLGNYALRQGESSAMAAMRAFESAGSRVTLEDAAAIHAKMEAKLGAAEADQVMNDLTVFKQRVGTNDEDFAELVHKLKSDANALDTTNPGTVTSLDGHVKALRKAASDPNIINVEFEARGLSYYDDVEDAWMTGKTASVDFVKQTTGGKSYLVEYNSGNGQLSWASKSRLKDQILRLEAAGAANRGTTEDLWLMMENGEVDQRVLKYAGQHGVRVVDGQGNPLNNAYYFRTWGL